MVTICIKRTFLINFIHHQQWYRQMKPDNRKKNQFARKITTYYNIYKTDYPHRQAETTTCLFFLIKQLGSPRLMSQTYMVRQTDGLTDGQMDYN